MQNNKIEYKKYTIIIIAVMILHLAIGLNIFKDYGIGYDDNIQHKTGRLNFLYLTGKDVDLQNYSDKSYGPVFEMILYGAEQLTGTSEGNKIFALRHLLTFIHFWFSIIVFWLILIQLFKKPQYGLIGILFLILSPRIFAESFYNTKDVALLSAFIFSFYIFLKVENKINFKNVALLSIVSAYTTAIRPFGLYFPIIFFLLIIYKLIHYHDNKSSLIIYILLYSCIFFISLPIFWPFLLNNPVQNFIQILKESSQETFQIPLRYMGDYILSSAKPWHYVPIYMLITIPPIISAFAVLGVINSIKTFLFTQINKIILLTLLLWIFLPLASIYINNPRIYDGWRHLYFIYPAIIIFSLFGLQSVTRTKITKVLIYTTLIIQSGSLLLFIIQSHPYQNVYFNIFTGNLKKAQYNFDFDYWGLSETEAIRYILNHDERSLITLHSVDTHGLIFALSSEERSRIKLVNFEDIPDYIITQHRWIKRDVIPGYEEIHTIKVDGATLSGVYKKI